MRIGRWESGKRAGGKYLWLAVPVVLVSAGALVSNQHSKKAQRTGVFGMLSAAEKPKKAFYLSASDGNDSWSGLLAAPNAARTDGPFRSLTRAQAAMRAASTKRVELRAGRYAVASPNLAFIWQDNSEEWVAYPGETVILDGGGTRNITLTGVHQLTLRKLAFENMGPGTITITGAKEIRFEWDRFSHCKQDCITGSALTDSKVVNNTFDGQSPGNPPGNLSAAYAAIRLGYGSSDNQIAHNRIENCQGGGIAFAAGPKDLPNSRNKIDRNLLRNVNMRVNDMGAIYWYDRAHTSAGNEVTNNIIDGNGGRDYRTTWTKTIYLDDGVSGVLVSGNQCRACGRFAWQIHGGDHNTITNNVFDLSSEGTLFGLYQTAPDWKGSGMGHNRVTANIVYFAGAPRALYQVNLTGDAEPPLVEGNLYYAGNGAAVPNGPPLADPHPILANPGLRWSSEAHVTLAGSISRRLAFQPLVTDQGPLPAASSQPD